VVFFGVASIETWRYVGFDAYSEWRKFVVTFVPPILTVLVQSLVLCIVTGPERKVPDTPGSRAGEFPKKNTDGGSIPFPTE
jgi:hypothetical protein